MGSDVAAVPVLRLDSIAGEEIQAVLPAIEAGQLTTSSRETKAERPALLANVGATLTSRPHLPPQAHRRRQGTRAVRLRLVNEAAGELYADRLLVHSLGRQTVTIADAAVDEGDAGARAAAFQVSLACPSTGPVSVAYLTVPGTAAADIDYVAAEGTLALAAWELEWVIAIDVLGDTVDGEVFLDTDRGCFPRVLDGPGSAPAEPQVSDHGSSAGSSWPLSPDGKVLR
jgi:hypothetical protein